MTFIQLVAVALAAGVLGFMFGHAARGNLYQDVLQDEYERGRNDGYLQGSKDAVKAIGKPPMTKGGSWERPSDTLTRFLVPCSCGGDAWHQPGPALTEQHIVSPSRIISSSGQRIPASARPISGSPAPKMMTGPGKVLPRAHGISPSFPGSRSRMENGCSVGTEGTLGRLGTLMSGHLDTPLDWPGNTDTANELPSLFIPEVADQPCIPRSGFDSPGFVQPEGPTLSGGGFDSPPSCSGE